MRRSALTLLRPLLWIIALSHLIVGAGIFLSRSFQGWMARAGGFDPAGLTGPAHYLLRMLGGYMIVLGILSAAAANRPRRHRFIVYVLVFHFALCAIQRVLFLGQIRTAFDQSTWQPLASAGLFACLALILLALTRMAGRR